MCLLARDCDRLDIAPVNANINQRRRSGKVIVPQAVVYRLKMPHTLSSFGIETHQGLRKEVVPRSMPPVVVAGRGREREVDIAKFLVCARRRPHVGVPRVLPRRAILGQRRQPGFIARLSFAGNSAKYPTLLTRTHIKSADVPWGHLLERSDRVARNVTDQRANDDNVVDDQWRRAPPETINSGVVVALDKVNPARRPKFHDACPCVRVQRHQVGPDDGEDASVLSIDPIAKASGGRPSPRFFSFSHLREINPHNRAGRCVERRDHAESGTYVEAPPRHEWSVLRSRWSTHRIAVACLVRNRGLSPHDT